MKGSSLAGFLLSFFPSRLAPALTPSYRVNSAHQIEIDGIHTWWVGDDGIDPAASS